MKRLFDIKLSLKLIIVLLFSQSVFHSCTDDSIGDNFYTFTGQTIADYLEDNNDKYSDFIYVLKESGI